MACVCQVLYENILLEHEREIFLLENITFLMFLFILAFYNLKEIILFF